MPNGIHRPMEPSIVAGTCNIMTTLLNTCEVTNVTNPIGNVPVVTLFDEVQRSTFCFKHGVDFFLLAAIVAVTIAVFIRTIPTGDITMGRFGMTAFEFAFGTRFHPIQVIRPELTIGAIFAIHAPILPDKLKNVNT